MNILDTDDIQQSLLCDFTLYILLKNSFESSDIPTSELSSFLSRNNNYLCLTTAMVERKEMLLILLALSSQNPILLCNVLDKGNLRLVPEMYRSSKLQSSIKQLRNSNHIDFNSTLHTIQQELHLYPNEKNKAILALKYIQRAYSSEKEQKERHVYKSPSSPSPLSSLSSPSPPSLYRNEMTNEEFVKESEGPYWIQALHNSSFHDEKNLLEDLSWLEFTTQWKNLLRLKLECLPLPFLLDESSLLNKATTLSKIEIIAEKVYLKTNFDIFTPKATKWPLEKLKARVSSRVSMETRVGEERREEGGEERGEVGGEERRGETIPQEISVEEEEEERGSSTEPTKERGPQIEERGQKRNSKEGERRGSQEKEMGERRERETREIEMEETRLKETEKSQIEETKERAREEREIDNLHSILNPSFFSSLKDSSPLEDLHFHTEEIEAYENFLYRIKCNESHPSKDLSNEQLEQLLHSLLKSPSEDKLRQVKESLSKNSWRHIFSMIDTAKTSSIPLPPSAISPSPPPRESQKSTLEKTTRGENNAFNRLSNGRERTEEREKIPRARVLSPLLLNGGEYLLHGTKEKKSIGGDDSRESLLEEKEHVEGYLKRKEMITYEEEDDIYSHLGDETAEEEESREYEEGEENTRKKRKMNENSFIHITSPGDGDGLLSTGREEAKAPIQRSPSVQEEEEEDDDELFMRKDKSRVVNLPVKIFSVGGQRGSFNSIQEKGKMLSDENDDELEESVHSYKTNINSHSSSIGPVRIKKGSRWSSLEVQTLEAAVRTYGTKWKNIRQVYNHILGGYSTMQLKDKARTLDLI